MIAYFPILGRSVARSLSSLSLLIRICVRLLVSSSDWLRNVSCSTAGIHSYNGLMSTVAADVKFIVTPSLMRRACVG